MFLEKMMADLLAAENKLNDTCSILKRKKSVFGPATMAVVWF